MIPSAPGGQADPCGHGDPAGIEPATFSLEVHRPQQELHCSIVFSASRLRPTLRPLRSSLSQFASPAARTAGLPATAFVAARMTDALPSWRHPAALCVAIAPPTAGLAVAREAGILPQKSLHPGTT